MSVPVILVNQKCIWWNGNCCFLRKCSSSIGKPLFGEESMYSNDPLIKVCHVNPALAQKSPRLSMSTNFSRKPAASSGVCSSRNVVEALSIRYLNRLAVNAPVNLLTNLSVSSHVFFLHLSAALLAQEACRWFARFILLFFYLCQTAGKHSWSFQKCHLLYQSIWRERERKKKKAVQCVLYQFMSWCLLLSSTNLFLFFWSI